MKTDALPVRCSCRPIEPTGFVHKRPHSPACWTSAVPLCLRSGCRAVRIAPALLHPGRAGCTLRAADAPAGALAKNFPLILPPPTSTHEDADSSSSSTFASAFQKIPSRVCQAQRSPNKLRSASSRCRSRASPSRITGIIICTSLLILDVLLVFPKSSERYKKEQTAAVRSFDGRG